MEKTAAGRVSRSCFVKPIPQLDYVGPPLFICLFVFLFWFQSKRPLRRQHFPALLRLVRNFVFSIPGYAIARFSLVSIPLAIAWAAESHRFGLLHWFRAPAPVAWGAGFLLMDWGYYWWHVAAHRVPLLWRFHNVHHTDLDLDVSTAARFHFGEIVLSVPFRVAIVALFGISPATLVIYELVFESAVFFHHSNSRLPLRLERILNRVIVTPRMHGAHHSIVRRETDSNWGTIFSIWDRLHRTLRIDVPQEKLTIGVPGWRDDHELTLGKLWLMPFRKQRGWHLPGGGVPEREPQPSREMAP
jgi:sterol desaturase/sphingolipid hydroxylase (fatty acid hydroxylase superfamily)